MCDCVPPCVTVSCPRRQWRLNGRPAAVAGGDEEEPTAGDTVHAGAAGTSRQPWRREGGIQQWAHATGTVSEASYGWGRGWGNSVAVGRSCCFSRRWQEGKVWCLVLAMMLAVVEEMWVY